MNDRIKEMNDFLLFWKSIAIENNDFETTSDMIYDKLMVLNCLEEDIKLREDNHANNYIDDWREYLKGKNNINSFCSNENYFLQFRNGISNSYNHIKLYIPLDLKHLKKGVENLFDFLNESNIIYNSKVCSDVRFDNVVMRLSKSEDAKKVIEFVKNNPYIQEGLIKPNPFAFQKDGIAISYDGNTSYNRTIAIMISNYLNQKIKLEKKEEISLSDFCKFYKDVLQNDTFFDQLSDLFDDKTIKSSEMVFNLFMESLLVEEFNFDEFVELYEETLYSPNSKDDILNQKEGIFESFIIEKYNEYNKNNIGLSKNQILSKIIFDMISFINSEEPNDEKYLYYNKIINSRIEVEDIYSILKRVDPQIPYNLTESDLEKYIELKIIPQIDKSFKISDYNKKRLFDDALKETIGISSNSNNQSKIFKLEALILEFLKTGEYALFTRKNNARKNLIDSKFSIEDCLSIIIKDLHGASFINRGNASEEFFYEFSSQYAYKLINDFEENKSKLSTFIGNVSKFFKR